MTLWQILTANDPKLWYWRARCAYGGIPAGGFGYQNQPNFPTPKLAPNSYAWR